MSFITFPSSLITSMIVVFLFTSCGEGGSSSSPQDDTSSKVTTVTGQFIDDKVQGLSFSCTSGRSGKTNAHGEYTCDIGDDVTFAIGPAIIGKALAQSSAITPYTLYPDDEAAAIALARILQSIDADEDQSNGIIIIDTVIAGTFPDIIDLSEGDTSELESIVPGLRLIEADVAKEHLDESIAASGSSGSITAEAGDIQNVKTGDEVVLDGRGCETSGFDGDLANGTLTYLWEFVSRPEDSSAHLSDETSIAPYFIADLDGEYLLRLTISRNEVTSTDEVLIIADTNNSTPVAYAGADFSIAASDDVFTHTFDGSDSSDADVDDVLSYRWSVISRPDPLGPEQIDALSGSEAQFLFRSTHLPVGEYIIELIVDDGTIESLPDQVKMTATNTRPIAGLVLYKDEFADGSGSLDPNGDTLTYKWSLVSSPNSTEPISLDWTEAFNALDFIEEDGFYVLELIVNDARVDSLPARLTIIRPDILEGPVVNQTNGHTYYLLNADYTWLEAEAMAVALGGHLVTINDQDEHEWVWSTFSGPDHDRSLWIGLTDKEKEDTFVWISGEVATYTNWIEGEPNSDGDEDYVELDALRGGGWNDLFVDGWTFRHYGVVEMPSP